MLRLIIATSIRGSICSAVSFSGVSARAPRMPVGPIGSKHAPGFDTGNPEACNRLVPKTLVQLHVSRVRRIQCNSAGIGMRPGSCVEIFQKGPSEPTPPRARMNCQHGEVVVGFSGAFAHENQQTPNRTERHGGCGSAKEAGQLLRGGQARKGGAGLFDERNPQDLFVSRDSENGLARCKVQFE